jgi:hypothetical protein
MISKDDKVMFRDAHDKLTLWLKKWRSFCMAERKKEWYKKTFKKYGKYHSLCSFCERWFPFCWSCTLFANGASCLAPDSLFSRVYNYQDKESLIEMIRIVDEAWEKARGE